MLKSKDYTYTGLIGDINARTGNFIDSVELDPEALECTGKHVCIYENDPLTQSGSHKKVKSRSADK